MLKEQNCFMTTEVCKIGIHRTVRINCPLNKFALAVLTGHHNERSITCYHRLQHIRPSSQQVGLVKFVILLQRRNTYTDARTPTNEYLRKTRLQNQSAIGKFVLLKAVTSEKIGGSGVISTLGTWYGGVVMGVPLPFNEAAILYRE
jgi:hypothetical protein